MDRLKGFPGALGAVYPKTQGPLCIAHLIRRSLSYVSWKKRKVVVRDLKAIYRAPTLEAAGEALEAFAERWDGRLPRMSRMWQPHWATLTPFLDYPPEIRKVIYTTNAIESLNASLRFATQGDKKGRIPV